MGFKRNHNKEYILQVAYDHDNNKIGKNVTKVFGGDGNAASAVTIKMMNMFPCVDDGSPTTYNVEDYKYTYLLSKDNRANTKVTQLIKRL